MATDLILKGALSLGGVDVSAEATGYTIKGFAADVAVPATLSAGKSHAAGARKYELTIDYLSTNGSGGVLFEILYTAILTATKELAFTGSLRDTAPGTAPNPLWSGSIVVAGLDLGGDVEALSTGSITCLMTGAPSVDKVT